MPLKKSRRTAAWLALIALLAQTSIQRSAADEVEDAQMEAAFSQAAAAYQASSADPDAAAQAFQNFISNYPRSPKTADAYFAVGESLFQSALDEARQEQSPLTGGPAFESLPDSSIRDLHAAEKNYSKAIDKAPDDALRASAEYRLGEIAYDLQEWKEAVKRFSDVTDKWPQSYAAPPAFLGLADADLAQQDFAGAAKAVDGIAEAAPSFMNNQGVAFVQGILALHSGDYARAERLLSENQDPRARYYLGRTYLLWKKPLLAARIFEDISQNSPNASLKEAAAFYLGDSFFVSGDYDGAIVKYQDFVQKYPFSRFKTAALYRIGGAAFEKGDYGQARLSFGSLISQNPDDFYAAYARYFIGESYLADGDARQALFAYSDLYSSRGGLLKPEALYRLAWAEQSLGDYSRAAQSGQDFATLYSTNPLANNISMIEAQSLVELKRYPDALAAYQRVVDSAPGTDIAEEALFLMLKLQYDQGNYGSIVTSYQFLLDQLPQSSSNWRSLSRLIVAEAYLRQGRLDEARRRYAMIVKVYPNSPAAVYAQDGLAWCDELSGRDEQAVADRRQLQNMLNSSTSTLAAVNNLGIADSLYAQKDYNDAVNLYQGFASAHPNSPALPEALYRAGISLYHLGYYSDAVKTWQQLLSQAPDSPEAKKASLNLADTLFRAQKYPDAQKAYQDILGRWPSDPSAGLCYLRLAQIAYQTGDDDGALAQVKALLTNVPQSGQVSQALDLAEAVFDRDAKENFHAFYSGFLQNDPQSPAAAAVDFRLASRLYAAKDYADAAKEFENFSVNYTDDPRLPKAQIFLGECYFNMGNYADAASAYERFAQNFPQDNDVPLALFKAGSSYYNLKEYDKAAAAYEKLLSSFPSTPYAKSALYNLALAYKDAGNDDRAEEVYTEYLKSSPGTAQSQQALWDVFSIEKNRKNYPAALKTLQQISAAATPGSDSLIEASYRIGSIKEKMGDETGAQQAWEAMISLRPASSPYRLQALINLSKIYEKNSNWSRALSVYRDLAQNADSPAVVQAAKQRIEQIQSMSGSASSKPGKTP